jgi:L,D-transpeptidase YcbB
MLMTRPSCFRICFFLLSFLVFAQLQQGGRFSFPSGMPLAMRRRATQPLSAGDEALLLGYIRAGRLADMKRPAFTGYRDQVKEFYESGAHALAWTRNGQPTPQALALAGFFRDAEAKGLPPENYEGPWWQDHISKLVHASGDARVRFDLALTVSAMRYLSDLNVGRANPRHLAFQVEYDHEKYDLARFLCQRLVSAQNVAAVVSQVEPPYDGYRRTIKALHNYRELALEGKVGTFVQPKKSVKPGDVHADLPRLAQVLRRLGDLPKNSVIPLSSMQYQGAMVEAVKRFQRRHGLDADGVLGRETFREIDTPLSYRVLQLELTLERWRWIPHAFPQAPVVVNIPEFRLRAFDEHHRVALSMKVVVGQAYRHQTPVFAALMKSVVFRPYWNVPVSIQQAELLPKLRRDSSYLSKHGYQVVDRKGNVVTEGEVASPILKKLESREVRIRQKPGAANSLGLVKFVFPNEHDVYLHDTPATQLFSKARRDFSHGCIRVEDPVTLAAWVLKRNPAWNLERIRAAMNGDHMIQVNLEQPIPVLILYGTAVVEENGEVHFFDDIYGDDKTLARVLAQENPGRH